jgi:hypothetical protein
VIASALPDVSTATTAGRVVGVGQRASAPLPDAAATRAIPQTKVSPDLDPGGN